MSNIELPLDITSLEIISQEVDDSGAIILEVRSKKSHSTCHKCGKDATKRYGIAPQMRIQHTSILDRPVYLKITPIRYQCEYCDDNTTTTEQYDWCKRNAKVTHAFKKYIMRNLINSTVQDVNLKTQLPYKTINSILGSCIGETVNWDNYESLDKIGIDEISLKKGHKDFVTIISSKQDNTDISILSVIDGRRKEDVLSFFNSIPDHLRKTVKEVCTDMYDGYVSSAIEVFGKQAVIIDRYHVAKQYRKPLDRLRIKEMKRLKPKLSDEEYVQMQGNMWIVRSKYECLTNADKEKMDLLFKHSPKLKEAYHFALKLTHIFNSHHSRKNGRAKIDRWIKAVNNSEVNCFNVFIKTLQKHKATISNYFKKRSNSGFVEGLNNKIKVIKRRCYGVIKSVTLFKRLQLDLTGYALFSR